MEYVFSLQATEFLESLEWKTDLSESEAGKEEAKKVRDVPRQTFSFSAFAGKDETQLAYNILYSGMSSQWGIPVWSEAQKSEPIPPNSHDAFIDTACRDFRIGSLAIAWESPQKCQILTITDVGTGYISYDEASIGFTSALVMPLRIGRISGNPTREFNGVDEIIKVKFRIEDSLLLDPSAPEQFAGYDVNFPDTEGLLEGDRAEGSFVNRDDTLDFDLGKISDYNPWNHSKIVYPYRVILADIAEEYSFREWLYRRAGRYRRFWMPTWEQDLRVNSSSSTSLTVWDDGFTATNSVRRTLAVQNDSGEWLACTIVAVSEPTEGLVTINLSESISGTVSRVCWLGLRRLQADRVEIIHGTGGVSSVSLNVIEVEPNGDLEGTLLTEQGLDFAYETGQPVAIEDATVEQVQGAGSKKISELTEASASEAASAGAHLVVAIDGDNNFKVPISDLILNGVSKFTVNVGTVGETSFLVVNQLNDEDVLVSVVDNVTRQEVGIACNISAGSILASGLSPIEVTNQFHVVVRK